MAKKIYFHVDEGSMPLALWEWQDNIERSKSYERTEELIRCGAETIHTTDMCHLSFDLIDMGYEIYLCYKGKKVKIEPDMTIEPIGKHLKRGHNIRKLFIGHAFDDMLGIECKKPVMQPKFLVSDEVVCEMTVRKVEEVRYSTEFNSYMYKLDKGGWFVESALKPNVQDSKKAYFKVGDFICHKYNSIYGGCRQIFDISGDSYLCTVPDSVAATCSISFSEQGNWRLWDAAKDAKEGDVLTLDGCVFIYAHRKQLYDIAVSHCFVNQYGEFFLDGEFGYTECGVQVLPATKEQRDFLFSKMKESGFTWDSENKTLKKIQKHCDISNFSVNDWITCVDDDGDTSIEMIEDFWGDKVRLIDCDGVFTFCPKSELKRYRLWTIQDAKVGDILSVDWNEEDGHVKKYGSNKWEKIVIFKSVSEQGVEGYGCTFVNGKLAFSDTEVPYYSKTWTKTLKPATKEQRSRLFAELEKAGYKWDNNKRELISTKPKLSVGNWVVYNNRELAGVGPKQIIDFVDDKYVLDYGSQGNISFEIDKLENDWHIWTFEDSKLGDILYDKAYNRIGIFENFGHHPDGGSFNDKTYCFLSIYYDIDDNELYEETHNDMDGCDAVPATKEQRDLLFAKMKEAGYEWDAEKKELHKIQHYDIANFHAGMPVLVRILDKHKWCYLLFSHCYKHQGILHFNAGGAGWLQCIPFNKDTEHLLGTTDMCDESFINW